MLGLCSWSKRGSSFARLLPSTFIRVSKMTTTTATPCSPCPGSASNSKAIVAVVGTTGVGKTRLAVDTALALRERGSSAEIINADSMQVYRGLDIITNKASGSEKKGVVHHLMDFLEPGTEYRVDRFRKDALQKIDEISGRQSLPIVVGGTMYFMQHLLFPGRLISAEADADSSSEGPSDTISAANVTFASSLQSLDEILRGRATALTPPEIDLLLANPTLPAISSPSAFPPDFPVRRLPPEYRDIETLAAGLYRVLGILDPPIAAKLHWRDIRKVRRGLEIIAQTGRPYSDLIEEQQLRPQKPEFRTLIFWLWAEPKILDERLDARVDEMLERGLLDEVEQLRRIASEHGHVDVSKGIYQSIGYREFASYLAQTDEGPMGDSPSDRSKDLDLALRDMKTSTRQYARRQIKWIRNKLVPAVQQFRTTEGVAESEAEHGEDSPDIHLYMLDATDPTTWETDVHAKALLALNSESKFCLNSVTHSYPCDSLTDRTDLKDFSDKRPMPDPSELVPKAAEMLMGRPAANSGTSVARNKIICAVCTTDPSRPVLIEEGAQMAAHSQTRSHRKRVQKERARISRGPASAQPDTG